MGRRRRARPSPARSQPRFSWPARFRMRTRPRTGRSGRPNPRAGRSGGVAAGVAQEILAEHAALLNSARRRAARRPIEHSPASGHGARAARRPGRGDAPPEPRADPQGAARPARPRLTARPPQQFWVRWPTVPKQPCHTRGMANDTPSAADLRALLARHEIRGYQIAPAVGLDPAKLGRLLNGREPLTPQLASTSPPPWTASSAPPRRTVAVPSKAVPDSVPAAASVDPGRPRPLAPRRTGPP